MPLANVANALQYRIGLSKQSALGTPATAADLLIPLWSGEIQSMKDISAIEVADIYSMRPAQYAKGGHVEGTLTLGAFTGSAALLFASLLGLDTKTGAGPYTHKDTIVDPNAYGLTFWQLRPDGSGPGNGLWERYEDCIPKSIEIVWAVGQPLKLNVEVIGGKVTLATTPTLTNVVTEQYANVTSYAPTGAGVTAGAYAVPASGLVNAFDWITAIGPTLKYIASGASGAAVASLFLESGSVKISVDTEYIQAQNFTPDFRKRGLVDVAFSSTALFKDYTEYRDFYTGSTSGTTLAQTLHAGALDFLWPSMQAGGRGLQVQVPNSTAAFGAVTIQVDPPAVDPAGGAVRMNMTGYFQRPATGTATDALAVSLINDVSSAF